MKQSIQSYLMGLFGILVVILVGVSTGLLYELKKGNDFSKRVARDFMIPSQILAELKPRFLDNRMQVMISLASDPALVQAEEVKKHLLKINGNKEAIDIIFKKYEDHTSSKGEVERFEALTAARQAFVTKGLSIVVAALEKGDYDGAKTFLTEGKMNPLADKTLEAADELIKFLEEVMNKELMAQKENYDSTMKTCIILLAGIITVIALVSLWIIQMIIRPIRAAIVVAETIASGDLTGKVVVEGLSETRQLLAALKAMQNSLHSMVDQVREGSESIASASGQIAAGGGDLASRTVQQAAELEQTTVRVGELAKTAKTNTEHAQMTVVMMQTADGVAAQLGGDMQGVVATMQAIDESSRRVTDIIATINSIAFQTNILALNAAVEAARAGDEGRGFAVVAAEVRTLAQRSAAAAKEIGGLITDSVKRVDDGITLVGDVRETLHRLIEAVQQAGALVAEMSMASTAQGKDISQVSQTLLEMDGTTQQNAALVEEAAAATLALDAQSRCLIALTGAFRTV
jgi:methyl-accepting chemotaxis protein